LKFLLFLLNGSEKEVQQILMNMQQLVIPAKAGIQNSGNPLKILDSRFYWNDEIMPFSSCYESINFDDLVTTHPAKAG
jgi:hypothetical protein